MSLSKAIASGKEHRKEYGTTRGSFAKRVDSRCRNHGGRVGGAANQCIWCLNNRRYRTKKREPIVLKEELDGM